MKATNVVFVTLWFLFYYLLFRYYILKIIWVGSLPMDYEKYDIHLLFFWMVGCAIGFGFWLKNNGKEFFRVSLTDKGGLLIISLIWILIFFLGIGLVQIISGWLGDYQQTITFWKRIIIDFKYHH